MQVTIPDDEIAAFWPCLGLGVLRAMERQAVTPETGIWTLGLPKVWKPPVGRGGVPGALADALSQGDELDLISQLAPEQLAPIVARLSATLVEVLCRPSRSGVDALGHRLRHRARRGGVAEAAASQPWAPDHGTLPERAAAGMAAAPRSAAGRRVMAGWRRWLIFLEPDNTGAFNHVRNYGVGPNRH